MTQFQVATIATTYITKPLLLQLPTGDYVNIKMYQILMDIANLMIVVMEHFRSFIKSTARIGVIGSVPI